MHALFAVRQQAFGFQCEALGDELFWGCAAHLFAGGGQAFFGAAELLGVKRHLVGAGEMGFQKLFELLVTAAEVVAEAAL